MRTKAAKKHFHYHQCTCGRWGCNDAKCNLSKHAKCGFKIGNDFTTCRKGKAPVKPFTFELIAARRVAKEITQKRFLCDAVRLNMTSEVAMQNLREYRKAQRKARKIPTITKPQNIIEIPEVLPAYRAGDNFLCCC